MSQKCQFYNSALGPRAMRLTDVNTEQSGLTLSLMSPAWWVTIPIYFWTSVSQKRSE